MGRAKENLSSKKWTQSRYSDSSTSDSSTWCLRHWTQQSCASYCGVSEAYPLERKNLVVIEGVCNCAAVAYKVDTEVSDVFICHCSICRKSTGSGGIAVSIVRRDKFTWISGQDKITYWSKPRHDWHAYFCSVCGSALPGENDETNIYIPVGTITTGHQKLKVAHHMHVESKASWEIIGDLGVQHPEGFGSRQVKKAWWKF